MIRISRIVAKDRIADLLDLNFVSKITLRQGKQGFKNPAICRVEIYLQVDTEYFNSVMNNIVDWERSVIVTLLLLQQTWLSMIDLLKNLHLMTLIILCQKSIRIYVMCTLTNILDYLIEEKYNGRQIRRII